MQACLQEGALVVSCKALLQGSCQHEANRLVLFKLGECSEPVKFHTCQGFAKWRPFFCEQDPELSVARAKGVGEVR